MSLYPLMSVMQQSILFQRQVIRLVHMIHRKEKKKQKKKRIRRRLRLSTYPVPFSTFQGYRTAPAFELFCNVKSGQMGTQKWTGGGKKFNTLRKFVRPEPQGSGILSRDEPLDYEVSLRSSRSAKIFSS